MTLRATSIRRHDPVPFGPALGPKGKCACGGSGGPCTACAGKAGSAETALAQAELAQQAGDLAVGALFPESASTGAEPVAGRDFTALRVHDRGSGAGSTANVSAQGFALGSRVASDPRRSPRTGDGRNLLAHDLAEVIHRSAAPGHAQGADTEHSPIPIRAGIAEAQTGPLTVSNPADASEREADRIAGSLFPAGSAAAAPRSVQSSGFLRPAKNGGAAASRQRESRGLFGGLAGEGKALPDRTRQEMELAFGTDLSSVRIHADSNADALSQSLEARAFTLGSDIFFGSGQFDTESATGKQLLAHELVHTVQQQSGLMLSRDGERRTTLQCVNENLSSAGVASWLLAIVGTTCGLIGALAGSPTGPGAAATAAAAAAVCIAGVVGFSVGFVLGILTGCIQDPNFRSAAANAR